MKRFFLALLVGLVFFGVVGCQTTTLTDVTQTTTTTQTQTTSESTTSESTTTTTIPTTTTTTTTQTTTTTTAMADATFQGVEDITIALGQTFLKMDGVTATDYDGADLTDQVITSGIVNVNRSGVYEVDYTVVGKNGTTVTITRIITVMDNAKIQGPELLLTNILINTPFNPFEGVTASDFDDEDLTDELTITGSIVNPDGSINTSVAGVYELVYRVTGKSGGETTYTIQLTIYAPTDATVVFSGASEENPTTLELILGFSLDIAMIATAKDYDGETLTLDQIAYDQSLEAQIVNNIFKPTDEGTFTIDYKATGKTGNQSTTQLTLIVRKQGVVIDGNYIPILTNNVNNDSKPWNSTIIYTELKGMGEYGVVIFVDAHGRIVFVRDAYGSQFDYTNPIKQGPPSQIRSVANAVGWTGANIFNGLLGPQGTPGGIPENGFAIYFNRDNVSGTTHPIRLLGLNFGREIGAYVEVIGLSIPNYNPPTNDATIEGIEDITLYSNEAFDPLAGVVGKDHDGTILPVSVLFNNVDFGKPVTGVTVHNEAGFADGYFAIIYTVTGSNGYTVHMTRRVTILPAMEDAEILGVDDVSLAIGQAFDPLAGVSAIDYDSQDLTANLTFSGTYNIEEAGVYELTYRVTGKNGVEVVITRTISVKADARFEVSPNRITTIYVNGTYNPLDGIVAFDSNGQDISSQIVFTSPIYTNETLDTSTIGSYELTYKVTGESGNEVTLVLTLNIIAIPDATIAFAGPTPASMFLTQTFNLLEYVSAKDYDNNIILTITLVVPVESTDLVVEGVFTPITAGTYTFDYQVTGANGVLVVKTLTITVHESGVTIDGVVIPILSTNINPVGKPADTIMIFTELAGMGEFGVLIIVDAHGRVILSRDAFGEQMDVNNPFKAGNPSFPTNLSGLPNFKTYDAYTGGLWTTWTKGGADSFEGLLGPQGTVGGIPAGGYAIYFSNGTNSRPLGLKFAREYAAKVVLYNLTIPNVDPSVGAQDAQILGVDDIEITANSVFDPLAGVSGVDHNGDPLTVSVVFNNVNTEKPVITPQPSRVINTVDGRNNYAQGWYSVVYAVTGANGYTVHVSRRVVVR